MRLLLLGLTDNSRRPAPEHLSAAVTLLAHAPTVTLIPYATGTKERRALRTELASLLDREVVDVGAVPDPAAAIEAADAIVVAAGNTWCLARELRVRRLVHVIQRRVAQGTPFIGWGAGALIASPSIAATTDVPACDPLGFGGLHLVPFQMAPLPDACERVDGSHCAACAEVEQRIARLSASDRTSWIVGLPPGGALHVDHEAVTVIGDERLPVFRAGRARASVRRGRPVPYLLDEPVTRPARQGHRRHCAAE